MRARSFLINTSVYASYLSVVLVGGLHFYLDQILHVTPNTSVFTDQIALGIYSARTALQREGLVRWAIETQDISPKAAIAKEIQLGLSTESTRISSLCLSQERTLEKSIHLRATPVIIELTKKGPRLVSSDEVIDNAL